MTMPERCGKCGASRANLEVHGDDVRCVLCGWRDWSRHGRSWTPRREPSGELVGILEKTRGWVTLDWLASKIKQNKWWICHQLNSLTGSGYVEKRKNGWGRTTLYRWIGRADAA